MSPFRINHKILVGSVNFGSRVSNHNSCEFLSVMALPCPEGRKSQQASPPSSLDIISAPYLAVFSEHWEVWYRHQEKLLEITQYPGLTPQDSDSVG